MTTITSLIIKYYKRGSFGWKQWKDIDFCFPTAAVTFKTAPARWQLIAPAFFTSVSYSPLSSFALALPPVPDSGCSQFEARAAVLSSFRFQLSLHCAAPCPVSPFDVTPTVEKRCLNRVWSPQDTEVLAYLRWSWIDSCHFDIFLQALFFPYSMV